MSRVAVIIPVRNGARYIAEALDSVQAQTRPVDDIVVVDDGSEDGTDGIVRAHDSKPRYLRQEPQGAGAARNRGVTASDAAFLAFLDADDLWLPDKIARQLAALGDPSTDLAFTHVEQFVSPDAASGGFRFEAGPLPGRLPSTLLVRRALWARIGGFDPSLRVGEFIDWCKRAYESGAREVMVPDVLCRRRLHRDNASGPAQGSRRDYVRVARLALERRRRSGE